MESQSLAIGVLGISLDDFLDMTPDEFVQAYNCRIKHELSTQREILELLRLNAYVTAMPNTKRPRPTIEKFWPFEWDKSNEKEGEVYDREAGKERFNELKNKWKD